MLCDTPVKLNKLNFNFPNAREHGNCVSNENLLCSRLNFCAERVSLSLLCWQCYLPLTTVAFAIFSVVRQKSRQDLLCIHFIFVLLSPFPPLSVHYFPFELLKLSWERMWRRRRHFGSMNDDEMLCEKHLWIDKMRICMSHETYLNRINVSLNSMEFPASFDVSLHSRWASSIVV